MFKPLHSQSSTPSPSVIKPVARRSSNSSNSENTSSLTSDSQTNSPWTSPLQYCFVPISESVDTNEPSALNLAQSKDEKECEVQILNPWKAKTGILSWSYPSQKSSPPPSGFFELYPSKITSRKRLAHDLDSDSEIECKNKLIKKN